MWHCLIEQVTSDNVLISVEYTYSSQPGLPPAERIVPALMGWPFGLDRKKIPFSLSEDFFFKRNSKAADIYQLWVLIVLVGPEDFVMLVVLVQEPDNPCE